MPIVFENIDTGETVGISAATEGRHYKAKLAAVINSSNMSINASAGQDFGWRLQPEQQAILEDWEQTPDMIEKVSNWSHVPTDSLTHAEFLGYMVYLQELGKPVEKTQDANRRDAQLDYDARVAKLRKAAEEMDKQALVPPAPTSLPRTRTPRAPKTEE